MAHVGKADCLGKLFIASVPAAINTFHLPECEPLPDRLLGFLSLPSSIGLSVDEPRAAGAQRAPQEGAEKQVLRLQAACRELQRLGLLDEALSESAADNMPCGIDGQFVTIWPVGHRELVWGGSGLYLHN